MPVQEIPTAIPSAPAGDGADTGAIRDIEVPADDEKQQLSPEKVREVVRLIQCPVCSRRLRDPVTLPCGRSLCKPCLPEPYPRRNISYPATPDRLQGFRCPFAGCDKEHPLGDCGADITAARAVALALDVLETSRDAARTSELRTHVVVVVEDRWEETTTTGVPALREAESPSRLLRGGRLLATFALVGTEELGYNAEVTYATPATRDHEDSDAAVLGRVRDGVRPEMDCQICYALFYDPVTTPCGHTFCRRCLQRVLDPARLCPVCRRALSIGPALHPQACLPNDLVTRIIATFWADLLEARKRNAIAEALHDEHGEYDTPVFVCTVSFPSTPTFLHVFEPRYRLMIRRALEGDRTFGMVMRHNGSIVDLGTILRIVNVEFYPDGRSMLETVGVSRFRILRHGVLDGYTVAKIQKIYDIVIAEEEELEAAETRQPPGTEMTAAADDDDDDDDASVRPPRPTSPSPGFPTTFDEIQTRPTRVLMDFAEDFVRRMMERNVEWLTSRVLTIYGECPRDLAVFPWWLASVLPLRSMEKYRLLGTTSVRSRLKICCEWILQWEDRTRW